MAVKFENWRLLGTCFYDGKLVAVSSVLLWWAIGMKLFFSSMVGKL